MMKKIVLCGVIGASLLMQTAAFAEGAAAVKRGDVLRDKDGRKVGKVDSVRTDGGFLTVIADMKIYRVPLSTVTTDGGETKTTLTSAEVRAR